MKIITDNEVYVQKKDIEFLISLNLPIPAVIFMKILGNGPLLVDDSNRYEFIKFDNLGTIDCFKAMDWIIDYNEVEKLTEEEIKMLGQTFLDEKNSIINEFNKMAEDEKKENSDMIIRCKMLDFKIHSLKDVIMFKKGYLNFDLPDLIDYYDNNTKNISIKKLIKRIFNNI